MDIAGQIKKLWKHIMQGNIDRLFDAISYKFPSWFFRYYHGVLVVTDNIDLPIVDTPGYFQKMVTLEDLDKLERFGIPEALSRKRLERGYKAAIVGKGEDVLSIVWGAPGNDQYPGEDGFMLYQAFTRPDARKKGLVFMAYQMLYDHYKAGGKFRAYGTINRLNETSFRVHKRFDFKTVGEFIYLILLGLGICLYLKWPFPAPRIQFFIRKPPNNPRLWFLP